MTRARSLFIILAATLLGLAPLAVRRADARSAVYAGLDAGRSADINDLRASGFSTVLLWSIHVNGTNGDLSLNDNRIVSNGVYVGASTWPAAIAALKQAPTSVNRIEVSVSAWETYDFEHIQQLIAAQGTGSSSILYKNFQALKKAASADAVNFDDESLYDVNTSVSFGVMLANLGYKVSFGAYYNPTFWATTRSQINSQRPGTVDITYLQCYAGGLGNDPAAWSSAMGMVVDPGLWSLHDTSCASGDSPASVQSQMSAWKKSAGIVGGFLWLYSDIQACSSAAAYAGAVNAAIGCTPTSITPYLQVNGGTWSQTSSASVSAGATVKFGPQPSSGGSWQWSGPNGFSSTAREITVTPQTTATYTAAYTNAGGCKSTQTFTITVASSGCAPTAITPYVQVNGGAWTQTSTASVNAGATVVFGPQPSTGGSWQWSGPNGLSSTSRQITVVAQSTGTYTATYTNAGGCKSTQSFTITVAGSGCSPTAITPYVQVNGGTWSQTSSATVSAGSTVKFGPQPSTGGSWSWSTGATSREITITANASATYTATYTNTSGCKSTQTFTITVSGTGTGACTGVPAWSDCCGCTYAVNQQVTYGGSLYKSQTTFTNTCGAGWTPSTTGTLWLRVGGC